MRTLLALSLFACIVSAEVDFDRVTELVEAEQFEQAYAILKDSPAPDGEDARFWDLWQRAVRGVARNRQRVGGYTPALEFLEQHLDTEALVGDYTETCIWAGEEERGLRTLRGLPAAMRDRCAVAEFQFYWIRQDYTAMERRAREVNRPDWVRFAREQHELRERFAERTGRAWRVALFGIAGILAVCWLIDRFVRPRTA
jgi:hypothetical protein